MQNPAPRLDAAQYECNFADLHPPLTAQQAHFEASRCLFCFEAPCITACPTHIDVPAFIRKIAVENVRGAARVILEANPLGASCARVCPVEALCEGACVVNHNHERPVSIGRLQRYATDYFAARGMPALLQVGAASGRRVALIGAGPASLGCAAELRRLGHAATIFERDAHPGGLNTYGIAQYKMTPKTSLLEVEFIRGLGVQFRTGVEVGRDVQLTDLRRDHDALFLGVGLGGTQRLAIPGEELSGVVDALSFIRAYKSQPLGTVEVGRRVIVIGAGNTAVDAATAAVRLGAERVVMMYRRGRDEMPAYDYEYELAKQDGIRFEWWTAPLEIRGRNGAVEGMRCARLQAGAPGSDGRSVPVAIPGSDFVLEADMVIPAIGQEKRQDWLSKIPGLELDRGRVVVDETTGMTSVPGIFSGGDCANGGMEVVNAVAEGQRAARGMHAFWNSTAARPQA